MKKLLLLLTVITLASCEKESAETVKEGNFEVEFLFEKDGCKIYRFYDGRMVYYSDCRGKIDYQYTESNGKTTITKQHETLNN